MTIKSLSEMPQSTSIHIDLTSPRGNAVYLLGVAKDLAQQLGKSANDIIAKMTSGDYEYLLEGCDEEFGEYVTLYR